MQFTSINSIYANMTYICIVYTHTEYTRDRFLINQEKIDAISTTHTNKLRINWLKIDPFFGLQTIYSLFYKLRKNRSERFFLDFFSKYSRFILNVLFSIYFSTLSRKINRVWLGRGTVSIIRKSFVFYVPTFGHP